MTVNEWHTHFVLKLREKKETKHLTHNCVFDICSTSSPFNFVKALTWLSSVLQEKRAATIHLQLYIEWWKLKNCLPWQYHSNHELLTKFSSKDDILLTGWIHPVSINLNSWSSTFVKNQTFPQRYSAPKKRHEPIWTNFFCENWFT